MAFSFNSTSSYNNPTHFPQLATSRFNKLKLQVSLTKRRGISTSIPLTVASFLAPQINELFIEIETDQQLTDIKNIIIDIIIIINITQTKEEHWPPSTSLILKAD